MYDLAELRPNGRGEGARGPLPIRVSKSRIDRVSGFTPDWIPTNGGVTVSTGSLAAKRHAGVWAPVIARKMIIADHQLAYAA